MPHETIEPGPRLGHVPLYKMHQLLSAQRAWDRKWPERRGHPSGIRTVWNEPGTRCQHVGERVYITGGVLTVLGVPGWEGEQDVAIKWPRHGTAESRGEFLREARHLVIFRGPGVVPLLGCGELPEFHDGYDDSELDAELGYALVLPWANLGNGLMGWSSTGNYLHRRADGIESVVRSLKTLVHILGSGPAAALSRVHRAGYMFTNITPSDIVFCCQENVGVVAWMGLGYCVGPVRTGGYADVYQPVVPWAPRESWHRDGVRWDWEDDVHSFGMSMLHIVCGVPVHYLENLWGAGTWDFMSDRAACRQVPRLLQAHVEEIVEEFALARWRLDRRSLMRRPMDPIALDAQQRLVRAITHFFLLCCLPTTHLPWGFGSRDIKRPTALYIHSYMTNFADRVPYI